MAVLFRIHEIDRSFASLAARLPFEPSKRANIGRKSMRVDVTHQLSKILGKTAERAEGVRSMGSCHSARMLV